MTSVFLLGFMACGKSTVGKRLAERCGMELIDLDELVCESEGKSPAEIIRKRGESEFRKIESRLLRSCPDGVVIAGGGGSFLAAENREELKRRKTATVFLDLPWEVLAGRIEDQPEQDRPLWGDDADARKLFESRLPAYRKAQFHLQLRGDEKADKIVDLLLENLPELKCDT